MTRVNKITPHLIIAFLTFSLTGCASDEFKNAGSCKEVASTKIVDNQVAICTGFNNKFKWYFEGESYDAVEAVGFIESAKAGQGLDNGYYETFYNYVLKKDKDNPKFLSADDYLFANKNLNDIIIKVTEGQQRWDSLIAALTNYVNKSAEADTAQKKQFEISTKLMKEKNYSGPLHYSQEYVDARDYAFKLSDEAGKAADELLPLLQVLEADLQSKLNLDQPLKAAKAIFESRISN